MTRQPSTDNAHSHPLLDPQRGDLIGERYRVLDKIGEGTFAKVYLAEHVSMPSLRSAIKILKPEFVQDAELHDQFVDEAKALALLHSRHTIKVVDLGTMPHGRPYLCMDYCKGLPLDLLPPLYGSLPHEVVAQIGMDVLFSLREAHHAGIVHRDIKPGNIMVSQQESGSFPIAHVLDFGIAHIIGAQTFHDGDTPKQYLFCTPAYAAPEVLRGAVSASADLYALGLTLAELIEGQPVYPDIGFYAVAAQQSSPEAVPLGPRTRQSPLYPVLARACQKQQDQRFSNATEMLAALKSVVQGLQKSGHAAVSFPAPIGCANPHSCCIFRRPALWISQRECPSDTCSLSFANSPVAAAATPPRIDLTDMPELAAPTGALQFDDNDFSELNAPTSSVPTASKGSHRTQRLSMTSLQSEIEQQQLDALRAHHRQELLARNTPAATPAIAQDDAAPPSEPSVSVSSVSDDDPRKRRHQLFSTIAIRTSIAAIFIAVLLGILTDVQCW